MFKLQHILLDAQTQHVALRRELKARRAYVSAYSKYLKKLAAERNSASVGRK